MRLLILGGTIFLGRHLAQQALERGHRVTLFHRGRHGAGILPQADRILGDRDGDHHGLSDGVWDAVIDTSGHLPRQVRSAGRVLAGRAGGYCFVSSLSVYADVSRPMVDETGRLHRLEGPEPDRMTDRDFGALKVACEAAARDAFLDRCLVVRPGLIVGPHDGSQRFTYWPARIARGGEVLAPAPADQPVQWIDVRDLAAWMLDRIEAGTTGTFNATGPAEPPSMAELLELCRRVTGARIRLTWVEEGWLLDQGIRPYLDLPLWVPARLGSFTFDASAARRHGLGQRPAAETIRDVLGWHQSLPDPTINRAGLPPERERSLLQAWHDRG